MTKHCGAIAAALSAICLSAAPAPGEQWGDWERFRYSVRHPALTIKRDDLARAKENTDRSEWAKEYVRTLEVQARRQVESLTPEYVAHMIERTTPGDRIFTPCPACRDQGKPYLPQGLWQWDEHRPDELKCGQCGTIFPNDKYPETIELHAHWGGGQVLTFYGGPPFAVFNYKSCRPTFSGNLRSRKAAYMGDVARNLAEAYALTGKTEYARGVRQILLRLTEVYPGWMVHVGYGEYADMDPAVAAAHIDSLPADELVVPPNKPDRKLYTGYWSAGRAAGTGLEGVLLKRVAVAYDLTCDAAGVWTDAERLTVERDLLLDGTRLLTADAGINNKSVTNRTAVAMIGMVVGEPRLVKWGLQGFYDTVDRWFLPDGGTPESFAYGLMALNGLEDMALAARGYSDPAGYADDGKGDRLDNLDLYHRSAYQKVWTVMFDSMQGDLRFPPIADSYRTSAINPRQAEILAANYPDRPQYLGLLRELCGDTMRGDASVALYYRDPALADHPGEHVTLRDLCLPDLRIGMMRTGVDGRESLLTMNASDWGNHHHWDSLGIYYWKDGRELLGDLGYLWDHPEKHMTARTVAHNTVVIDGADQVSKGRGGTVELFASSPHAKAMRATSKAYPAIPTYERTSVLVDHGGGRSYVVDFFRVAGGTTQDYVFHAPADLPTNYGEGVVAAAASRPLYDFNDVNALRAQGTWRIGWDLPGGVRFDAWAVSPQNEQAFVARGWGQRDFKNADVGAKIPYVVRRTDGPGEHEFVSVFEAHGSDAALIAEVCRDGHIVVVRRADGRDDRITSDATGVTVESTGPDDKAAVWLRAAPAPLKP